MPNSVRGAMREVKKAHNHIAGREQRANLVREVTKGAVGGGITGMEGGPLGVAAGAGLGAVGGFTAHVVDRMGKRR